MEFELVFDFEQQNPTHPLPTHFLSPPPLVSSFVIRVNALTPNDKTTGMLEYEDILRAERKNRQQQGSEAGKKERLSLSPFHI